MLGLPRALRARLAGACGAGRRGSASFADGWRAAALDARRQASSGRGARARGTRVVRGARGRRVASSPRTCVEREAADGAAGAADDRIPPTLSASSLMDHARCPKRFYWSRVRPLPRFSGPAARIGTEIHRWIERRAAGQGRLLESDDAVDLTHEELAGDPGRVERLRQAFLEIAVRRPDAAVRRARVPVAGRRVRASSGRIDAIYGEADGPWEVVDWKTGSGRRRPAAARALRARVRRDLAQGARGADAHLLLPRARRGGVAPDGRPRRGAVRASRRRSRDRARGVRADAGSLVRVLRLQGLLRRRQGLARRQRLGAGARVEPLDLLLERR